MWFSGSRSFLTGNTILKTRCKEVVVSKCETRTLKLTPEELLKWLKHQESLDGHMRTSGYVSYGHAPSCSRSKVTSNGRPYVLRTSMENKHHPVSGTFNKLRRLLSDRSSWSSESPLSTPSNGRRSIPWHSSMWYTVTSTGYVSWRVWKTSGSGTPSAIGRCTYEYATWIVPLVLSLLSGNELKLYTERLTIQLCQNMKQ